MALRKKLSASLLLKADGKSVKTSSENMINDYIQKVEKLKIKNDKLGYSFWRELSFMVLDTRIPLILANDWFEKLWMAHDLFMMGIDHDLAIKPISFYNRMISILQYRHLDSLKFVRKQEWQCVGIDLHDFKEARDEKIQFYRDFATEIDDQMIAVCQKMTRKEFRQFLALIHQNDCKTQIDLSVVLSLVQQGNNLEGLDQFMLKGVPMFLEKLKIFDYKKDYRKVQLWFDFWKNNIPFRNHDEIVKGIGFLPNFVVENGFDQGVLNYLSWGNNIKNYNPSEYFFTNKMSHLFHNYKGEMKRFVNIYHECLLRSNTENENLIEVFLNYRLGTTKDDVTNYALIIKKMESWNFETVEHVEQQKIMGYLIHGFQEVDDFSLKSSTLISITRRANEYYDEILVQKAISRRAEKFSQLTISGKKREKRRERKLVLRAQRKIEAAKERLRLQKWKGIPVKDATLLGYSFVQLTNLKSLITEGKRLRHCVGSNWYAKRCVDEGTSIWSFSKKNGTPLLTIELTKHLVIVQARGLYNRNPTDNEMKAVLKWANERKFTFPNRSR